MDMDVIKEIEDAVEALLDLDEPGKPTLSERKAAAVRRRYEDAIRAARMKLRQRRYWE